jgi:phosphoribosylformylglycinamidine cyclo-ligase
MERTFNMGVGMVAVLPEEDVDRAQAVLTARHVENWVIGRVEKAGEDADAPRVTLEGSHARF